MMTGSGSVVYGVFATEEAARNARTHFEANGIPCMVTRTAPEGIVLR
jgi:4-diphosphocytidyl-2C-methyl-D-erythritol kinase